MMNKKHALILCVFGGLSGCGGTPDALTEDQKLILSDTLGGATHSLGSARNASSRKKAANDEAGFLKDGKPVNKGSWHLYEFPKSTLAPDSEKPKPMTVENAVELISQCDWTEQMPQFQLSQSEKMFSTGTDMTMDIKRTDACPVSFKYSLKSDVDEKKNNFEMNMSYDFSLHDDSIKEVLRTESIQFTIHSKATETGMNVSGEGELVDVRYGLVALSISGELKEKSSVARLHLHFKDKGYHAKMEVRTADGQETMYTINGQKETAPDYQAIVTGTYVMKTDETAVSSIQESSIASGRTIDFGIISLVYEPGVQAN